jgi:hypothetical protein
MELEVTAKGALYACECAKCGCTMFAHEWAHMDNNERRDAMQAGTLRCDTCCVGVADPKTFVACGQQYAARMTMPGYLDCTDWLFGTNRRELEREVRS